MPSQFSPRHQHRAHRPRREHRQPRCCRGFTLIELMIVVAVVAILVAIAYPSYAGYLAKGRRADAKQALLDVAQRLERFYTERGTYAGAALGNSGLYPSTSKGGYYSLAIDSADANGFAISAAPTGVQTGDACGTYGYNHLGEQTLGANATQTIAQCW